MGQDQKILISQVQAILLNEKVWLNVESLFLKKSLLHDTCVLKNLSGPSVRSSHINTCKMKRFQKTWSNLSFIFWGLFIGILFFLFTCCITIEHNEGRILFFFFVNKPKLLIQISILFSRFNFNYSPGTIFINQPNFRSGYCNSRKVMKIRFRTTLLEQEHI